MDRRALVIGSDWRGLVGVEADVRNMTKALRAWGFEVRSLCSFEATRDAILEAYDALITSTKEGDAAVVYYSGHGGYTDNPSAVEGTAEAYHQLILPVDFVADPSRGPFRGITDLELSHLQHRLTNVTDNVVVILDCCHSERMSRNELAQLRCAAKLTKWTEALDAHIAELRASGRVSEAYTGDGNPKAVRLVACAQDEPAYGRTAGGDFTVALLDQLEQARGVPTISWRRIMARVRDLVLSRGEGQMPDVEGPDDRRPFETTTVELADTLGVGRIDDAPVLQGGRLMGLEQGDVYLVMAAEASEPSEATAIARAIVTAPRATLSQIEVEYLGGHTSLPDDAKAFLVGKNVRRGLVRVRATGTLADRLGDGIRRSSHLGPWSEGDTTPPMATIEVTDGELGILDGDERPWLERSPASEASLAKAVRDLEIMARAEALRRLTDGEGPLRLRIPFEVECGRVTASGAERFADCNGRARIGEQIYVKVTNKSPTDCDSIHVSVFDIGLTGRIGLVGHSSIRIRPGEFGGCGVDPFDGIVGYEGRLEWPDGAPRDVERRESLLIIVTNEPHDLRAIQGSEAARGAAALPSSRRSQLDQMLEWFADGGTRAPRSRASSPGSGHHQYAIRHVDFFVRPT